MLIPELVPTSKLEDNVIVPSDVSILLIANSNLLFGEIVAEYSVPDAR